MVVEPEWETWERLSYRQLRRKCVSARCNLTIFARPGYESWPEASDAWVADCRRNSAELEVPFHPRQQDSSTSSAKEPVDRLVADLTCEKHGPKFLELENGERQWTNSSVFRNYTETWVMLTLRSWNTCANNLAVITESSVQFLTFDVPHVKSLKPRIYPVLAPFRNL